MLHQQQILKLHRINLSYKTFLSLQSQLDTLEHLSKQELCDLGFTETQYKKWTELDADCLQQDLAWLQQPNNYVVTVIDVAYPALLKTIYDPPLVLYVKGNVGLLSQLQIAMVGSRNPSRVGKQTAFDFAKHLASIGAVITSGLATGIDAAGHEGALSAGGRTIAVCGTGLDRVYPAKNHDLAERVAESGALVSEFAIGVGAKPYHFPKRNRIISGLSIGTLVVEAARQSGSLITAKQAMEQGREVFAVPGSIHNPLSRGCHQLIKQGAKLVETAEDILEELGTFTELQADKSDKMVENDQNAPILGADYQQLLQSIGFETTAVDVIVSESGLAANQVASMLLILELNSYVSAEAGGYYRLK